MNRSKSTGRSRVLASMAMLCGAIFTIMLAPAYAQQDVSPDWYDPAPSAAVVNPAPAPAVVHPAIIHPAIGHSAIVHPAVVHSAQQPIGAHRYQQTAKSVSQAPDAKTPHVKATKLEQTGDNSARRSSAAPSGELVASASSESH